MRPLISIDGIDLEFGISKVDIIDSECDTLRLDELPSGKWELTVSKTLAPNVVDRLKFIAFDQFERPNQPCYAVWRGTGIITPLNPRDVNELRNDGMHHGGFIHITRHPGEKWEIHTADTYKQKIETRKIERINFNWNVFAS